MEPHVRRDEALGDRAHLGEAGLAREGEAGVAQRVAMVLLEEVFGDEAWLRDPSKLGQRRLGCQGRPAR